MQDKVTKRLYPEPEFITIISGLPRSGTSMMMKMLEAGGMEILTDGLREADESNPNGYYELESVRKLKEGDFSWIEGARGKAVKVISALLEYLPPSSDYRILFMRRNMYEILASQKQMLIREDKPVDRTSDENLARIFQRHLADTEKWMKSCSYLHSMDVNYNQVIVDPLPSIKLIQEFLGFDLNKAAMLQVIDYSLYREKIRTK